MLLFGFCPEFQELEARHDMDAEERSFCNGTLNDLEKVEHSFTKLRAENEYLISL